MLRNPQNRRQHLMFAEAGLCQSHNPGIGTIASGGAQYARLRPIDSKPPVRHRTVDLTCSTAVESMQLGGLAGLTALTMGPRLEKGAKREGRGKRNHIRPGTCVGPECGVSYGLSQWAPRHRCIRMSHKRRTAVPGDWFNNKSISCRLSRMSKTERNVTAVRATLS